MLYTPPPKDPWSRQRPLDDAFDPEAVLEAWADKLNVTRREVEQAIWVVGYDVDAVRDYIDEMRAEPYA